MIYIGAHISCARSAARSLLFYFFHEHNLHSLNVIFVMWNSAIVIPIEYGAQFWP